MKAVDRRQFDVVKVLISNGAALEAEDRWGRRALHYAVMSGQLDTVELLISEGANVEARARERSGPTPLHMAVEGGHQAIVKLLLDKGAYIDSTDYRGQTPLHIAVHEGRQDMVELLLANDAAPWRRACGRNLVGFAMLCGLKNKEMVEFLVDKGFEHSPVHVGAYLGDTDKVKSYLAGGGDINVLDSSRLTLLVCAMAGGQKDEAEFLVGKGADINLKGCEGMTALLWAAFASSTEFVRIFLDNGGDVTIRNQNGLTALHFCGNKDTAEMLLARGADVNARSGVMQYWGAWGGNDAGWTPLHWACWHWRQDVAEVLIAHGADVNAKTKKGATPLSFAKRTGNDQIVELLRKHGAKE